MPVVGTTHDADRAPPYGEALAVAYASVLWATVPSSVSGHNASTHHGHNRWSACKILVKMQATGLQSSSSEQRT